MPYSVHQRDRMLQPGHNPIRAPTGSPIASAARGRHHGPHRHEPMVAFLERMFGDEIVFMTYLYARSEPGHPGISLHTDGQPYGSEIFGYECSCPVMVKVLYYLDDLTPDVSPFSVLPRSHLSLHHQANPYQRYRDHPDLVMVTATAGSALVLHPRVFHGTYANVGRRSREMLQLGYRPAWSGPIQEKVPAWDPEELDLLPSRVRRLFTDRNACKFRTTAITSRPTWPAPPTGSARAAGTGSRNAQTPTRVTVFHQEWASSLGRLLFLNPGEGEGSQWSRGSAVAKGRFRDPPDRLRRRRARVGRVEGHAAVGSGVVREEFNRPVPDPIPRLKEAQVTHAHEPVGTGGDHGDQGHQGKVLADLELQGGRTRRPADAASPE